MKITIKATNLKLTPSLKKYIEEKINGLEKFIPNLKEKNYSSEKGKPPFEAWVEVGKTTVHHYKGKVFRAECQIRLPGKSLRAESIKEDLYLALDEIKDELQREIKKHRQIKADRFKKISFRIKKWKKFISG